MAIGDRHTTTGMMAGSVRTILHLQLVIIPYLQDIFRLRHRYGGHRLHPRHAIMDGVNLEKSSLFDRAILDCFRGLPCPTLSPLLHSLFLCD